MIQQLKLFDDREQLMLPEALIDYRPGFFTRKESDHFLNTFLSTVPWQQSEVKMYEKKVWAPRLSAWFGEKPIRSDDKRKPLALTPELLFIKERVETQTGIIFDGVLLNYYRNNNDSVAWHSDKDTVHGLKTEIASVSFGQKRYFDFRNKENHGHMHSILLEHGCLLLMKGDLQRFWEHRIAKSAIPMRGRINLTFRKLGN